jgi:hypothetical protein
MKKDSTHTGPALAHRPTAAQLTKQARPRHSAGPKATRHHAVLAQEPSPVLALERGTLALGAHGHVLCAAAVSLPVTHWTRISAGMSRTSIKTTPGLLRATQAGQDLNVEARHRRRQKIGATVALFGELAIPVAGGVLHLGGKKEWSQAQLNPKKGQQGGCPWRCSPWRGSWQRSRSKLQ